MCHMAKRRPLPGIRDELLHAVMSAMGKRGGPARAKRLSRERRLEIARMGGRATKLKWQKINKGRGKAGSR